MVTLRSKTANTITLHFTQWSDVLTKFTECSVPVNLFPKQPKTYKVCAFGYDNDIEEVFITILALNNTFVVTVTTEGSQL